MAANNVVRGTNTKPVASDTLARFFESNQAPTGGELFVGYPITTAADGKRPIDAVYVSPQHGVVVFDLVEGTDLGDFVDRQDDDVNRLDVKLRAHRDLVRRRELLVQLSTVTFAPALSHPHGEPDFPVANEATLAQVLADFELDEPNPELFLRTVSALQSMSRIRRTSTARVVVDENSRGARLKALEGSIATLDAQQSRAVIETASDVQRIRGLAGSGKTVVLALKAAYLHAQHPELRIAVTFMTRSLREQFRSLITMFSIEQAGEEPDWTKVQILPAWGARGGGDRDGIYYRFCVENDVAYYDFASAKAQFGGIDPLSGACSAALDAASEPVQSFDVVLVDEAQDLPPSFLRMCYQMLGPVKRLVYAYDELQNLNASGLPPAEEIFGTDRDGRPLVTFDRDDPTGARRDIILYKCYRNSRPVLSTAHALGFGIFRTPPPAQSTGLVQIFEQKDLWGDIGYRVTDGSLADGARVRLARTRDSSPLFLENHSPIDDLIEFRRFETAAEQARWVAAQIKQNLEVDEMVANDIIVINPDPFTTRNNVGILRKQLVELDIDSHLAGVDTRADVFFSPESSSVTVTGVYRAKGNEAGMVYVVNAQEKFTSGANLAQVRNRLFTAVTRSKAWVRVTGVGPEMDALIEEFNRIKASDFALDFVYPNEEVRAKLRIVHRDKSQVVKKLRHYGQSLGELVSDLERGAVYTEDLDAETVARLRALLSDTDA
ncbi:DEAD/DEAH box helicase [Xylanimonas ulmi]|uniref:Superfamily I DNA and RNA helicase n=1 Tax=Xylanimonas ulmi TaxID=228973 RepID=A0A4V2EXU6_9MICO|nr:ATP-binding domain-containing protein [Xylanibacterium ulmi]RZS60720.1 superfamily I DNA and RNA helicase [Xylanibacterium ulmi]